jgi:DNA-directed RNA polymerase specialized sigma subunit
MNLLKMRLSYRNTIHQLENVLIEQENDLSGNISSDEIRDFLHKQRIRSYLNQARMAYEQLGLRLGEAVPEKFLGDLTKDEKIVFTERFTNKKRFSEIASMLNTQMDDVKKTFNRALLKVQKRMGG